MSVAQLPHVGDADFDETVLADPSPALIEFYATWCAHCRKMAPIIEQLAKDYAGRLRVIQVDAPQNLATAQRFGVQGVPTLVIWADGREVDRIVGETSRQRLDEHLAPVVQSEPVSAPYQPVR